MHPYLRLHRYSVDICSYSGPSVILGSGADLKKIWFAMLLPTHPKQALPEEIIAVLRFFLLIFL